MSSRQWSSATLSFEMASPELPQFLLLCFFLAALCPYSTSSPPSKLSYADHCDSVVPHSIPTSSTLDYSTYISLTNGFFTGGDMSSLHLSNLQLFSTHGSFYLYSENFYPTRTPKVLKLTAKLSFHAYRNSSRQYRHQNLVGSTIREVASFTLSGFWSKSTGKICMVGFGNVTTQQGTILKSSAVFKLNYPQTSDISTSLVNGTLESLDTPDSMVHFDPISILVYAQNSYIYTRIPQARYACAHADVPKEVLGLGDGSSASTCSYLQTMLNSWFELQYENPCSFLDCGHIGFTPTYMSWNLVGCSDNGKVHLYIGFYQERNYEFGGTSLTNKSFVAEGSWDPEKNRLCLLAFPIMIRKNSAVDASVGDATIGISMWFPGVFSIESRRTLAGRIWSEKAKDSLSYSRAVSFWNMETNMDYLPGVRYEYTRTHYVNETCGGSKARNSGGEGYPDGTFMGDLTFDISLKNDDGYSIWGSATPLSLGDRFYSDSREQPNAVLEVSTSEETITRLWNISYKLSYSFFENWSETNTVVDISAEGIYNAETGTICMVGCQDRSNSVLYRNSSGYPTDCEVSISIQLVPMNARDGNVSSNSARHLNGTIRSTRRKGDLLYFEPLEMSSNNMYTTEAIQSIWRMNVEIIMVLVSKTLSCILIVLQLLHIKKYPKVLPSISIAMLVLLTLGHLIPLVLNFEALFIADGNKQNVLLWSGGWLEAKEVIVRFMTMLAFLLQLRLLQSAWNARSSVDNKKSLLVAERKAIVFCLPLYLAGALFAWFAHTRSDQTRSEFREYDAQHVHSRWENMTSYAGLLLDSFLLPQIILNMIGGFSEKALSPLYYIGLTVVRALPHLYDAYRARYYVPSISFSVMYASPYEDFYSSFWDIIIPLGGALFAVIVYFQQKFSGNFFLPKRFRSHGGYEMVPVASPQGMNYIP